MPQGLLGQLNVVLSAETVQFHRAMDKAAALTRLRMDEISKSGRMIGAVLGGAMVTGATAFGIRMRKMIEDADNIGKMAQALGITTEELSKLRYAGDLAGVSIEELQVGINRLNRNAADGNKIFKELGINVRNTDGTLKDSAQLIEDVAGEFEKYEDGAAKAAFAQEIFGKSGTQLIPLLNQGREGIKKLYLEAEKMGVVISSKTARQAEEFNDNMQRLRFTVDGVFYTIANDALPILTDLSAQMVDNAEDAKALRSAGDGVANTLITLLSTGKIVTTTFKTMGNVIGDTAATMVLFTQGKFKEIRTVSERFHADDKEMWEKNIAEIEDLWANHWQRMADIESGGGATKTGGGKRPLEQMDKDADQLNDTMNELGATFTSQFEDAIVEGKKFQDVLLGLEKDLIRIFVRRKIMEPLFGAIFGGGVGAGNFLGSVFSAKGNVFHNNRLVSYFEDGGVIGSPIAFPMAGGKTGVAGEKGFEAIMPLKRTAGGDLGVSAEGVSRTVVNVYAPPGSQVTQDRHMDGGLENIDIFIDKAVAGNMRPGTHTHRALRDNYGLGQKVTGR